MNFGICKLHDKKGSQIMLEILAESLLLATGIGPTDARARALRELQLEDEAWRQKRRMERFADARTR